MKCGCLYLYLSFLHCNLHLMRGKVWLLSRPHAGPTYFLSTALFKIMCSDESTIVTYVVKLQTCHSPQLFSTFQQYGCDALWDLGLFWDVHNWHTLRYLNNIPDQNIVLCWSHFLLVFHHKWMSPDEDKWLEWFNRVKPFSAKLAPSSVKR